MISTRLPQLLCLLKILGFLANCSEQECVCLANGEIEEGIPPSTLTGRDCRPGDKPTMLLTCKYVNVSKFGPIDLRGSTLYRYTTVKVPL